MAQRQITVEHPIDKLKQDYANKINFLCERFRDEKLVKLVKNSFIDPEKEINDYFGTADEILLNADMAKHQRAFLRRITHLECFKLRLIHKSRPSRPWNPLDETFSDFCASFNDEKFSFYYAETPYPSIELITDWLQN